MLLDIRPDHLQMVRDILQKHVPQYEVWAFGSRAKWTAKDYSDLDLCVVSDKPLNFSVLGAIAEDFSDSDLPWKVDVVDWATTSKSFRNIIKRDKVVVQKMHRGSDVSSEWTEVRLEEVTSVLGDGLHGTPEYDDQGDYHFINGNNLSDGRIIFNENTRRTSAAEFEKHKKNLNSRTIFVSINGTLGNVALYRGEKVVLGKSACYFNVREDVDKQFVRYVITSDLFQNYIHNLATGSTIMNVSLKLMRNFRFMLPTLELQERISAVLVALDDKIELNRRMNETLEAIARAMFKSWFVDFDPVRAKMSGEPTESICQRLGLTPELLALFPDRLVDSELGDGSTSLTTGIPEGWSVKRVDDVLELSYGKALKASERIDGPVSVYGSGGITGCHNDHLVDGPGIIIGRKGTVGSLYWEDQPFFPIDTAFYVKPKAPLTFCFYLLQTLGLERMNTDAAVPGLNRNNVYRLLVACSSDDLLLAFDNIVKPLREKIYSNLQESQTLVNLRDTLLPKLLSGELSVPALCDVSEECLL